MIILLLQICLQPNQEMLLLPLTGTQVKRQLERLNRKTAGPDGVRLWALKACAEQLWLCWILQHLFNLSLTQKKVPVCERHSAWFQCQREFTHQTSTAKNTLPWHPPLSPFLFCMQTKQTPFICKNILWLHPSGDSETNKKLNTESWWFALWHSTVIFCWMWRKLWLMKNEIERRLGQTLFPLWEKKWFLWQNITWCSPGEETGLELQQ